MPVPELLPPNAGKDELEKVVLGAAGCAGGKLLVALAPPKALLPPKPPNAFAPPFAGAGAEAPKLKPFCCGAPKFALCDRPEEEAAAGRRAFAVLIFRAASWAAVAR